MGGGARMLGEYFQVAGRDGVGEGSLVWPGECSTAAAAEGARSTT